MLTHHPSTLVLTRIKMTGTLLGMACLFAGAVAQDAAEVFSPMEFVIPLYIAPTYPNGTVGEG